MDESHAANPYNHMAPTKFSLIMVKTGVCFWPTRKHYSMKILLIPILSLPTYPKKWKLSMFFPANEQSTNQPLSDNLWQQVSILFSHSCSHKDYNQRATLVSLGSVDKSGEEPWQLADVIFSREGDWFVRRGDSLGVELLEGAVSGADCPTTLSRTQPE